MDGAVVDAKGVTYTILVGLDASYYVIVIGHDSTKVIPTNMIGFPLFADRLSVMQHVLGGNEGGFLTAFLAGE